MDVRGYTIGPIDAKGAFTSEIDLPPIIKPGEINTLAEVDRPYMADQPGMRNKYLPLSHDPATGAISTGGRYLFRGFEDATKYRETFPCLSFLLKDNSRFAALGSIPPNLPSQNQRALDFRGGITSSNLRAGIVLLSSTSATIGSVFVREN
jgi:hypothetical protein